MKDEEGNIVTEDVDGNPVRPQVTDKNGFYIFENLPADRTYTVEVDREAFERDFLDLVPTIADAGERPISSSTWFTDFVLLTEDGQHDPTLDFGFFRKHVSVGDYVWLDENKDGLQDDGEPGIPGVVLVITDEEGNPVTDVFGNPVGPTTTDENGRYTFDNLPINNKYIVSIDREASEKALKDLMTTLENAGDRTIDSSTWTAISEFLDQHEQRDPTLNFGFVRVTPKPVVPVVPELVEPTVPEEPIVKPVDPETPADDKSSDLPATGESVTNILLGSALLVLGGLLVLYDKKWLKDGLRNRNKIN